MGRHSIWAEANSGIPSDPQQVGRSATGGNPYQSADRNYQRWRPAYSPRTAYYALYPEASAAAPANWFTPQSRRQTTGQIQRQASLQLPLTDLKVLDVGAGTGKFTMALLETGAQVSALEPAGAMTKQFQNLLPQVPLVEDKAENMAKHYRENSFHVITFAQCWHWLKPFPTCQAAAKLLTTDGHLAIIFHQLNVSFPWVKRLSRVMRSGDVHFPDRPPKIGPEFHTPRLRLLSWGQKILVSDLFELAKTRSSYLRASLEGQKHLQQNLADYLYQEEQLVPQQPLTLPYYTLIWTAQKRHKFT